MTLEGKFGIARLVTMLIGAVVLVVCVVYIATSFHWSQIWSILRTVDLWWLLLEGVALILAYWFIRALRWFVLLRSLDLHIGFLDLYMCTAISLSVSNYTPFQSGEMLKVELLKKYARVDRFPGYGSFVVERAVDLVVVVFIAIASLLFKLRIPANRAYAYWALVIFVLTSIGALLGLQRARPLGRAGGLVDCMRTCVKDWTILSSVVVLTLISWSLVGISWQVFLRSIAIDLGFTDGMALMSMVALVSVLSLVPGGLGIAEVGTAEILIRFGYGVPAAQAGALILRTYGLLALILAAFSLGWWGIARKDRLSGREMVEASPENLTEDASL